MYESEKALKECCVLKRSDRKKIDNIDIAVVDSSLPPRYPLSEGPDVADGETSSPGSAWVTPLRISNVEVPKRTALRT